MWLITCIMLANKITAKPEFFFNRIIPFWKFCFVCGGCVDSVTHRFHSYSWVWEYMYSTWLECRLTVAVLN